jgi:inositol-phosphate transport system permease protein
MPILPKRWPLIALLMLLVTLPLVAGLIWLLTTGFFDRVFGLVPQGSLNPRNWRFLWEASLNGRPSIWVALGNSVIFAVAVAAIEVLIASMAAYAISRMRFPFRGAYLGSVLMLHAFPAISLIIALFYMLRLLGLFDTLIGVILVKASLELPLGIWLMKGFFDNLSWDMEMAALVDGASRWTVFWKIALPLVRPGLLALSTFALLSAWGEFILPFTLIVSGKSWTLALYLQSFLGESFTEYGLVAAVGFFYALPVILLFLLGQRYLLNIYSGGSKG